MQRASHVDRDGVRTIYDPRVRRLWRAGVAASLIVVAITGVALWRLARARPSGRAPAEATARPTAEPADRQQQGAAHRAAPHAVRALRQPSGEPDAATAVAGTLQRHTAATHEPEIGAREVIEALVASGETEGIAAFPPPGSEPIHVGIVVPEDFELPEGYVRHYQATDDGQRLDAILMFSPDYDFTDEAGNLLSVPPDRIVPAELAPAGMPVRMLEPPYHESASTEP